MMLNLYLLLICVVINVESAKILGIFYIPSYSHNIMGKTLLKALAERGHDITMVSPFPLQTPTKNYEDIYLDEVIKFRDEGVIEMLMETKDSSMFTKLAVGQEIVAKMNDICLNHVKTFLLASNRTFDLVIMDWVLNEAMLGIAHHYKAPIIVLSALGSSFLTNKITINPAPHSYVPNIAFIATDEMSFLQRVQNTISVIILDVYDYFIREPQQNAILHKYFPKAPHVTDLVHNISAVFINSHLSIESPRPYLPNMIQIAGLHIQKPNQLEKDLKKFMDEAHQGVLLFSLGSNLKSEELSTNKLNAIVRTFEKLPLKILWKVEPESELKMPANVKTVKWLPQSDILAHPNTKVFVTHGGLLSVTEAVYHGVPMVGIPIVSDQDINVRTNVHRGYSTMVHIDDLTEEALTSAIEKVLNDERYRNNVRKGSYIMKDQPVKPLDNAIFWVEYVLRHRGAPHLQTSALKLRWYQYYLLDVIAFLVTVVTLIIFIFYKIVQLLKGLICRRNKRSKVSKKAKKD